MGTIVLSLVSVVLVSFLLSRQSQSTKILVSEVIDAESRRMLSDAGILIASNLRDDRDAFKNTYSCIATPPTAMLQASLVGLPQFPEVFFSCHMPTTNGEFYLKLERRKASNMKSVSSILVQGSKCRRTVFTFDSSGAPGGVGYVAFVFDPSVADRSDHKWSGVGGTEAGLPANCFVPNVSCYKWTGATTITLKSTCANSIAEVHFPSAKITRLKSTFKHMAEVNQIHLNNNELTDLPPATFENLNKVTILNLHYNSITNSIASPIPANVFKGMTELKTLNLMNNALRTFGPDPFQGTTKLANLYLHNDINTSGFSQNNFSAAPLPADVFKGLTELKTLILSRTQLSSIVPEPFPGGQGTFSGLANLEYLDLSVNSMTTLQNGTFNGLTALKTLYLHYNQLGGAPPLGALPQQVFFGLTNLETLHLMNNALRTFGPDPFQGTTKIVNLYLHNDINTSGYSQNNFSAAPLPADAFKGLTELRNLALSRTRLTSIIPEPFPGGQGTFSGLSKLENLDLAVNSLTTLQASTFSGLGALQNLQLSYNNLTGPLPQNLFSGLTNLETLNLMNNALTTFDSDPFQGTKKIKSLSLHNDINTSGYSQNSFSGWVLPASMLGGLNSLSGINFGRTALSAQSINNLLDAALPMNSVAAIVIPPTAGVDNAKITALQVRGVAVNVQ